MQSEDAAIRLIRRLPTQLGVEVNQSAQFVNTKLRRIARALDRYDAQTIRQFEHAGIKNADDLRTMALLLAAGQDGLSNSEILADLGGSKAGISNRLNRLTSYGNITQSTSARDRRSQTNVLTPTGVDIAERLVLTTFEERGQVLAAIDQDTLDRLSPLLDEVIQKIDPDD